MEEMSNDHRKTLLSDTSLKNTGSSGKRVGDFSPFLNPF
jgi:hypothetical protein